MSLRRCVHAIVIVAMAVCALAQAAGSGRARAMSFDYVRGADTVRGSIDDVLLALRSTASQRSAPDNLLGWGIADTAAAVNFQLPVPLEKNRRFELSPP
jgi:hypothetical protein